MKKRPCKRSMPEHRHALIEMHEFKDENGDTWQIVTLPERLWDFVKLLRQRKETVDK